MYKYKKAVGFTIVELTVVIIIIAILATIAMLAYSGYRDRANDAAVKNDLNNMGISLESYQQKHGTLPEYDSHNARTVLGAILTGDGKTPFKVNADAYGAVSPVYANLDDGTIVFGYIPPYHGDESTVCVIATSKSGNSFVFTNINGTVEIGDKPVEGLGGTYNYRYYCGSVGGVEEPSHLLYGGYNLHDFE